MRKEIDKLTICINKVHLRLTLEVMTHQEMLLHSQEEITPHLMHQHSLEALHLHLAKEHRFLVLSPKENNWQALVELISIIYQKRFKIK